MEGHTFAGTDLTALRPGPRSAALQDASELVYQPEDDFCNDDNNLFDFRSTDVEGEDACQDQEEQRRIRRYIFT